MAEKLLDISCCRVLSGEYTQMSRSRRHTPIGPFFCCNSNHISEKLEKRWRNRMIRAAARNALVRALRLNECLEDVEALYAEPKPWCFIKLYGTEKEGKYCQYTRRCKGANSIYAKVRSSHLHLRCRPHVR